MKRLISITLLLGSTALAGTSTLGEGDSYAWAANIGWIELIPQRPNSGDGIIVSDTNLSGYGWSDSTGWINFGDGTPSNGIRYANSTGTDSGVNHDGAGNLSGLAWSANLGWINFGWWTANPSDANRPHIDLMNGVFTGYAWSTTTGWINLGTGLLKTDSICRPDADGDGISDAWEIEIAEAPSLLTATGDYDGDGITDLNEYLAGTNPIDPESHLHILDYQPGKGNSSLTWTSNGARVYRIGQSTDLQAWTWSNYEPGTEGMEQTTRSQTHPLGDRRFFRVQAALPLDKVP